MPCNPCKVKPFVMRLTAEERLALRWAAACEGVSMQVLAKRWQLVGLTAAVKGYRRVKAKGK